MRLSFFVTTEGDLYADVESSMDEQVIGWLGSNGISFARKGSFEVERESPVFAEISDVEAWLTENLGCAGEEDGDGGPQTVEWADEYIGRRIDPKKVKSINAQCTEMGGPEMWLHSGENGGMLMGCPIPPNTYVTRFDPRQKCDDRPIVILVLLVMDGRVIEDVRAIVMAQTNWGDFQPLSSFLFPPDEEFAQELIQTILRP